MTNLEKLKAKLIAEIEEMDVEQFEIYLGEEGVVPTCPYHYGESCPYDDAPECADIMRCRECSIKWLKEEVKCENHKESEVE